MAYADPELQPHAAFSLTFSLLVLIFAGFAMVGCGKGTVAKASTGPAVTAPTDPQEAVREGIRQGATQLTETISSLHDAVDSANDLSKSTKDAALRDALSTISDNLDDAGASIADYSTEPPELEAFKADFANQDDRRVKAIIGANDALHDLDDATDALDPFLTKSDQGDKDAIQDLEDSMEEAQDTLEEAIKSMGGKVEEDDTTDVSADPTQSPAGTQAAPQSSPPK